MAFQALRQGHVEGVGASQIEAVYLGASDERRKTNLSDVPPEKPLDSQFSPVPIDVSPNDMKVTYRSEYLGVEMLRNP